MASTWRMSAPTIVPEYPPRPPKIEVPPMTAAATDGSSNGTASDSVGRLDEPDVDEPADARQQCGQDIEDDEDLPHAHAREASRPSLSPTA